MLKTVGDQQQDMSNTYTLTVAIESYEFSGEFYILGDRYDTGKEVLKHVATDHILAMKQRPHIAEYLLETLQDGENVSTSDYEQADPDVSCGLHFDVDHHRFRFWVGDHTVDIGSQPTKSELRSIADDLPM
jgi:leucyl-tRNA synthetase